MVRVVPLLVAALVGQGTSVLGSFAGNHNYRSPSHRHPSLGVAIPKVQERSGGPSERFSPDQLNFTHGIASGDPYPTSVILWTRCAPSSDSVDDESPVQGNSPLYNPVPIHDGADIEHLQAPVCLEYRVATDEKLRDVVDKGTVFTSADVDYTVKVEASNLQPFKTYFYQFTVCNSQNSSGVGRTKTAPADDDSVDDISIAVYSCSNFGNGFFNAYGNVARKDSVDYVIHLGDYIYESKSSGVRTAEPDKDIHTLYEYRKRHATYKTDEDLRLNHAKFPWIPTWDDHEVADNSYRDGSSFGYNNGLSYIAAGRVSVDQRKMNAVRAYFEWMPIRQVDMDDNLRIWRNFRMGKLLDIIMLDTRQYDRSIADRYFNSLYIQEISGDTGRTMMGPRQENWFYNTLKESSQRGAAWRIIGSQVVMARVDHKAPTPVGGTILKYNYDSWSGYQSNFNRMMKTLYENGIGNNIAIAGDSHANWVSDLAWVDERPYDPNTGDGAVGVEFAGTAVTSSGLIPTNTLGNVDSDFLINNPANRELQWSELFYRGYFELRITPEKTDANFFAIPDIKERSPFELPLANFTTLSGENKLARTDGAATTDGQDVENGALRNGKRKSKKIQYNTETGSWSQI